jgi:hypothetical protein
VTRNERGSAGEPPSSPRSAPALKICATSGCDRPARKRGRVCARCNTRLWRKRNKDACAERERTRTWNAEQTIARRALGYLSSYLRRRNAVNREPCFCGRLGLAHQPDLAKPLEVEWLCRDHRQAARERTLEALADARAAAERAMREAAYRETRKLFLDAWPLLPPERREAIRAQVRLHPWGRGISEESPLWVQLALAAFQCTN